MHVYTLADLFCMTRAQLFVLHASTIAELDAMPEGSPERDNALLMLRCIRSVLVRPSHGPG